VTDLWTRDFDFELPEDRIALRPAEPRDAARLLVVDTNGRLEHTQINRLPDYLSSPDRLILNDSRVIAARLLGRRAARAGGGANTTPAIEIMLHKRLTPDGYLAYARPARKLVAGDRLELGRTLSAWVVARGERGEVELRFDRQGAELDAAIEAEGEIPLPPYIAGKRKADARDKADYQTVYAADPGSVAAPTAGLHFTPALLSALEQRGVGHETVTLHVGAGTFLPVHVEDTRDHVMHAESATLTADAAERLNAARAAGGRLIAVGTTSLRTLESAADERGMLAPMAAATDIFITPGYRFRAVDVLLTNFHLPRSTLFMLVCAFCGVDRMRMAYEEAIRSGYRFYSYGDACLLFRAPQ
jgi:S-adenosylmethionine:tRNA ribosyltransferase-isomerase